ncbi:D-arabinono-1,4-lactone oxidase [Tulasnella sp. JGI-2019a]|nr:D-arabinono-1,4-lactone oxidase [Tulasnella sp. JGI-2019a]
MEPGRSSPPPPPPPTISGASLPPSMCSTSELSTLLAPVTLSDAPFANWAGTYKCRPQRTFMPTDSHQLPYIFELARRERTTVRAAGAGHSPSDLACTSGFMVRTDALDRVLEINVAEEYVIVEGGISLHKLHAVLADNGLGMSNVGSISDQSVAGIVTTATHGTGLNFGVIPTHVDSLVVMLPDGRILNCSRSENFDIFQASRCGLGATGFIVSIKLKVERAFRLRERRKVISFDEAVSNLDKLANSSEHSKLWWFPSTGSMRFFGADRTYDPATPVKPNWFWDFLIGYHLVQLALFLGRFLPMIVPWVGHLVLWLGGQKDVVTDDSFRIFNLDCLVRSLFPCKSLIPLNSVEMRARLKLTNSLSPPFLSHHLFLARPDCVSCCDPLYMDPYGWLSDVSYPASPIHTPTILHLRIYIPNVPLLQRNIQTALWHLSSRSIRRNGRSLMRAPPLAWRSSASGWTKSTQTLMDFDLTSPSKSASQTQTIFGSVPVTGEGRVGSGSYSSNRMDFLSLIGNSLKDLSVSSHGMTDDHIGPKLTR